jgi:hypothetical protein
MWIFKHGDLIDIPFEPRIFRVPFATGFTSGMIAVGSVFTLLLAAILHWAAIQLGFRAGWGDFCYAEFLAAFLAVAYTVEWLRPTYFRVVPGRLDVMRFGPFLRGPARRQSLDLRRADLLIDLRKSVLFVDLDDSKHDFAIAFLRDRTRFAYYLLLAAISTFEPAELPDDALLG